MDFKKYISEILNEVRWEDSYSKGFIEFRKKYLKQAKDHNLYVRFSYTGDPLERNPNENPDHHDPVGIYAYPLKYVVMNPADIWYGKNSKYLLVIRRKSKNYININHMTENQVSSLFWKMGLHSSMIDYIRKMKKFSGSTMYGKIFFYAIQHDINGEEETSEKSMFSKKNRDFPYRNSQEQTQLLNKLGIDVIVDSSKTSKQAVINEREPEQILFLNRNAFEIIDVFNLNLKIKEKESLNAGHHIDNDTNFHIIRKFSQQIAEILGSKLYQGGKREATDDNITIRKNLFWTKDGQSIQVEFLVSSRHFDTHGFGEKKHKEFKLFDYQEINVELSTKKGKFNRKYMSSESFKDILNDISRWFSSRENDPDFKPHFKDDYIQAERQARAEAWEKNEKSNRDQQYRAGEAANENLIKLSEIFEVPYTSFHDDTLVKTIVITSRFMSYVLSDSRRELYDLSQEEINRFDWGSFKNEIYSNPYVQESYLEELPESEDRERLDQIIEIIKNIYESGMSQAMFKTDPYVFGFVIRDIYDK